MIQPAPVLDDADQLPPRPLYHHLALTVYWLSNSLLWGALLHTGLQSRLSDWFTETEKGYYFALIGALGAIVGTAAQMVAGAASDRFTGRFGRRRPFLVAGVIWATPALFLFGRTGSYWPMVGALVFVQLGTNAALGPFSALLPDTVNPREHGKASGFLGLARLLGDVGGIVLAGMLLSTASLGAEPSPDAIVALHNRQFPVMCNILAVFMFVTMVINCLLVKERPLQTRPDKTVWQSIRGSFDVDVRGNPDFFWLSLSRAVTNVGFYMFLEVLLFYLQDSIKVDDPAGTNMKVLLPGIGAALVGSIVSGIISDRRGRRPLIFVGQYVMAASCVVLIFARSLFWVYVAAIPGGLAFGIFTAVEWALACNLLPKGEAARYLGVWNASAVVPQVFAFGIAGVVGSGLAAVASGLGWRVDFALVVVCCLVGAYFLKHVHERVLPGQERPVPETEPPTAEAP